MTKFDRTCLLAALLAACAAPGATLAVDAAEWHVRAASLRYKVDLVERPTLDSAGYIVTIPDGGALPGPNPVTTVVEPDGTEVPSYILYYARKYGMAVLFARPRAARSVFVYIRGDTQMNLFTPESGLTPSMLLYVRTGQGSLGTAKQLRADRAQDNVQFILPQPQRDNPLPFSCEVTLQAMHWQGPPYAARMTGYLLTADPGRTWVSAFSIFRTKAEPSQDGMEVYIDGNRVKADTKLSDKSCGRGQWVDLAEGLHTLDIYQAVDPARDRFSALVFTWRTPKTTAEEMGGTRASDLPYPGTPMWDARPLFDSEVVRSGKGVLSSVEERNGGPVACFESRPMEIFWISDETKPLLLYEFRALTSGNPKDAVYTWLTGGEARIEGRERTTWLFPGFKESAVTLTVASGSRKATTTIPFFGYNPRLSTDLNQPAVRQAFRDVCLTMLQAYAPNQDATATWSDTLWELFLANLDLGSSQPLLAQIFPNNWEAMKSRLDAPSQWRLEDAFYEWFSFNEPEQCLQWLERVEKNERHAERRKELRLMRAELCMYLLADIDTARQLASSVATGPGDVSAMARVRLGDIEWLQGNLDEATRIYGEVQTQSKTDDYVGANTNDLQWSAPPKWKADAGRAKVSVPAAGQKERVADWKKSAVLDTSASETLKELLSQGYYEEARNVLIRWERLLPLSKLSSDFTIHQADLYRKLGNCRKARALLEAYCKNVEVSSYLAPATDLLLECMEKTGATDTEVEALVTQMKKQLEFHPVAEKMNALLNKLKQGGAKPAPLQ